MPKVQVAITCALTLCLSAVVLLSGCSTDPAERKQKFFESGNRHFDKADYRAAIIEYRNAIAIDAKFGEARARLGESYARIGDGPHALAEFVRAADLLPEDFDVQLKAGAFQLAADRPNDALERAEAALRLKPSDISAHILKGNALAGLRSFDEALASIEEAIRLDPDRGATFTQKGLIELASGRKTEAEKAFKEVVKLAPREAAGHLALGHFYWSTGRVAETRASFDAAFEVEPDNPAANRALAALALAGGRVADAEPYLRRIADKPGDPGAVLALANYYLLAGRSQDAIARLTPLASDTQNVPGARQLLARAQAVSGNRAAANQLVEQMLAANKDDLDAQVLRGQLLFDEGKRDDALAAMKATVASHPASAEAHFLLGGLYAGRGDASAAEAEFREVLRINPRVTAAQVQLSRLQLSVGNASASLRTAEEAARTDPSNLDARLTLVRSLLASREVARVERELADLSTRYPQISDVQAQVGHLAVLKNDLAGGRKAFERALSLNNNSIEALTGLITLDVRAKNVTSARTRIQSRLAQGETPELLMLAARTYASTADINEAERYLRRAIEADPTMLPAYAMLGQLYLSQKKLDQALTEFESLAKRQARPVAALTMSGIILQQQGKTEQARKRFEDVLVIDPHAAIAANNLAWLQVESGGNLDDALRLAETAASGLPDVPEVSDTLGWIYYKKNQPSPAIRQFEKSVAQTPNNASFHYHLGLAHLQAGDAVKGRAALQRALVAGPDAQTAADIKRLLEKSGSQ
jgi:putative PEP-CTERM system TPR-repeat lipoprotein